MSRFLKVFICIALVMLLCGGVEGKRKKNKGENKKPTEPPPGGKKEGEECTFHGVQWGKCAKPTNCPGDAQLNCAGGLRCCQQWKERSHDEGTISDKEYSAYLKLHDNLYQ